MILYHVGMFFVPWPWHIKNETTSELLMYPMFFVNQWRLPILFVVSGMGTRFALSFRSGGQFVKERILRLFVPLVFGILLTVAPQIYLERLTQGAEYQSLFQFYPDFFKGRYPIGNFTWHHLWFLPYLLTFSLVLTPVFLFLRSTRAKAFFTKFASWIQRFPSVLFFVVVPVFLVEISLSQKYPMTYGYTNDWYTFAYYGIFFLSGYLFISVKESFWPAVQKLRYIALGSGVIFFAFLVYYTYYTLNFELISMFKVLNLWSWVLAIFGFSSKYLNRPSRTLRYRNEAVYPFYIIHQVIIITLGFYLMNVSMPVIVKFVIMVIGTLSITWLVYEFVIRRLVWLRPLFGLKNKPKSKSV